MTELLTAHRLTAALPSPKGRIAEAAQRFEAQFLGEMLKYAGLGKMPENFNGGAGEEAFSDFFAQEVASQIARERPLGIGDKIAKALAAREAGS